MRKSIDKTKNLCYIELTEMQESGVKALFNQNLLKAKITEKGTSVIAICNMIGICEATFYRKMSRNGDFSRFEIGKIAEALDLSADERDKIFFNQKLA